MLPCTETKILRVLIDSKLRFKNHIKKVSYKELKVALTLKRMRVLTLSIIRQLFGAFVPPVIDYALLV